MAELSISARKQARTLRQQLQRGQSGIALSGARMRRVKSLADLQAWCDAQGIGVPLRADGGWRFDHATLRQLEQALTDLGLTPLDEAPATSRIGRLRQGAQEHKTLGEAPLQHRIQCSMAATDRLLPVTRLPARWVLDMDWRDIDLAAFDGLLVVENVDVFYACGSADWPLAANLSNHLIVYRGHDYRRRGVKALQQAWQPGRPHIYFGDLDPKGVSIALHEGYSHMLLPPLEQFRHKASTLHAPARQEAYQRQLVATLKQLTTQHPLSRYLQQLVRGRGLLQQAMLDMQLVPVALG